MPRREFGRHHWTHVFTCIKPFVEFSMHGMEVKQHTIRILNLQTKNFIVKGYPRVSTSIAVNLHAFSMRRMILKQYASNTAFRSLEWQRWSRCHWYTYAGWSAWSPVLWWRNDCEQNHKNAGHTRFIHFIINIVSLSRFHFLLSPSSRKQLEITRAEIPKNNTKTMFASNKIDNMCHNYKTVTSDIRYIWRVSPRTHGNGEQACARRSSATGKSLQFTHQQRTPMRGSLANYNCEKTICWSY